VALFSLMSAGAPCRTRSAPFAFRVAAQAWKTTARAQQAGGLAVAVGGEHLAKEQGDLYPALVSRPINYLYKFSRPPIVAAQCINFP